MVDHLLKAIPLPNKVLLLLRQVSLNGISEALAPECQMSSGSETGERVKQPTEIADLKSKYHGVNQIGGTTGLSYSRPQASFGEWVMVHISRSVLSSPPELNILDN